VEPAPDLIGAVNAVLIAFGYTGIPASTLGRDVLLRRFDDPVDACARLLDRTGSRSGCRAPRATFRRSTARSWIPIPVLRAGATGDRSPARPPRGRRSGATSARDLLG
jgi:hypothetical protein